MNELNTLKIVAVWREYRLKFKIKHILLGFEGYSDEQKKPKKHL